MPELHKEGSPGVSAPQFTTPGGKSRANRVSMASQIRSNRISEGVRKILDELGRILDGLCRISDGVRRIRLGAQVLFSLSVVPRFSLIF